MRKIGSENDTVTAQWLADRGYTIERASKNVGVSKTHLLFVVRGKRKPSKELMKRVLNLPVLAPVKCRVASEK